MSRILLVATAAGALTLADGSEHPTGFWAEELVTAHRAFTDAGHEVIIASPGGARPPVDPTSITAEGAGGADRAAQFVAYLETIAGELDAAVPLATIDGGRFDAIVIPGGHGPMVDLATDSDLGALLVRAVDDERIVAPFCHGPAALLSATRDDGSFAFAGRRLAVFTNEEELAGGLGENAPWFVADALTDRGVVVERGEPWQSVVVRDGSLISGQNPQSSDAVAEAVVAALAAR